MRQWRDRLQLFVYNFSDFQHLELPVSAHLMTTRNVGQGFTEILGTKMAEDTTPFAQGNMLL